MILSRLIGAAVLVAAVPAFAQPAAPPPPGPPGKGEWAAHAHAHQARRVQMLHDILRIQPEQEPAFQAWLASMRPEHGPGREGEARMAPRPHAEMATLTTPQRLDMMQQKMDAHVERMRADFARRAGATKALYAELSPDQRKVMDDLPMLAGGFGGHGMGYEGMGPEGMGREGWGGQGPHPMGPPPPPPSGD